MIVRPMFPQLCRRSRVQTEVGVQQDYSTFLKLAKSGIIRFSQTRMTHDYSLLLNSDALDFLMCWYSFDLDLDLMILIFAPDGCSGGSRGCKGRASPCQNFLFPCSVRKNWSNGRLVPSSGVGAPLFGKPWICHCVRKLHLFQTQLAISCSSKV